MSPLLAETIALLADLREGEQVTLTRDGNRSTVTVQRAFRVDVGGGSREHGVVTVGYGPGRWNTEVSARMILDGYAKIERKQAPHAQRYRPGIAHQRMDIGACPECGRAPELHSDDLRFWSPEHIRCDITPDGVRARVRQYLADLEGAQP